jgi:hypothetical protein
MEEYSVVENEREAEWGREAVWERKLEREEMLVVSSPDFVSWSYLVNGE